VLRGDVLAFNLPLEDAAQLEVLYSNIPLKLRSRNFAEGFILGRQLLFHGSNQHCKGFQLHASHSQVGPV